MAGPISGTKFGRRAAQRARLGFSIALLLLPGVGAGQETRPAVDSQVLFSSSARPRASESPVARALLQYHTLASPLALRTIPFFEGTFTSGGQTYRYAIVGRNPSLTKSTTRVRTVIVPLRLVFADGQVFDPSGTIPRLRRSPLFRGSTFTSGVTQYGDAIQRAEFWAETQGTAYHVLLRRPTVTATAVIRVPAAEGLTTTSHFGGRLGVVNEAFFAQQIVPAVIDQLHIAPSKLTILWSYNVDLQSQLGEMGAILGEHDAGTNRAGTKIWTWAWASWHTPDTAAEGNTDVAALSHEIAEWYNNPFVSNMVPPWQSPPAYPCTTALEVGDPVAGITFSQDGYHLQDEVFLSWFARQEPSTGIAGMYTYLGTLIAPPPLCSGS